MFPIVVKKAYSVSPPGAHGQKLRQNVVNVVVKRAKVVFEVHEDFKAIMEQIPGLGAGLSRAFASRPDIPDFRVLKSMLCVMCNRRCYVASEDVVKVLKCPHGCNCTPKIFNGELTQYRCLNNNHVFTMGADAARRCPSCMQAIVTYVSS